MIDCERQARMSGNLRREGRQDRERNREKKKAADKQSGVGLSSENPITGIEPHETNREKNEPKIHEEIAAEHRYEEGVSEAEANEGR